MPVNMISLGVDTTQATAALSSFQNRFGGFMNRLSGSVSGVNALNRAFSSLKTIIAGGFGIYAIVNEMQRLDSLKKTADSLGISFERMVSFSRAGLVSGFKDVEGVLARGIEFLEKLREGDQSAKRLARSLNITTTASISELIRAVSEAKSMYIQTAIFGRGTRGRDVGALLNAPGGVGLSTDLATAIERFNDSVELFKQTVTQELIVALRPVLDVASTILQSNVSKSGLFGGASLLFASATLSRINRGLFAGRDIPDLPMRGQMAFVNGFLKYGDELKQFLAGGGQAKVFTAANMSRAILAQQIALQGVEEVSLRYQRLITSLSKTLGGSAILPLITWLGKSFQTFVSFAKVFGGFLLKGGLLTVAGYGLYKSVTALYEQSRAFKNAIDRVRNAFSYVVSTVSEIHDKVMAWVEKLYRTGNVWTSSIAWSIGNFLGRDFEREDIQRKQRERLNKLNPQYVVKEFSDQINAVLGRIDVINEIMKKYESQAEIKEFKTPKQTIEMIETYIEYFTEVQRRYSERLNQIIELAPGSEDAEKAGKLLEETNNIIERLRDGLKRINENLGETYRSWAKERIGVDISEPTTREEIAWKFKELFDGIREMLDAGVISSQKYWSIFGKLWEDYIKELTEKTDFGEQIRQQEEARNKVLEEQKRIAEYMQELWGRGVEIVRQINPYEKLRAAMSDAYEAFINGFLSVNDLYAYGIEQYKSVFNQNRTLAAVGQGGITGYFQSVFSQTQKPVYVIQNILLDIYRNGLSVRV